MDTLKAIQVFVTITKFGSLTKAAEFLGYSRAMTSRYLEHLENKFATRLLHRNTRNVSLTIAGEKALIYCENILQQQQLLQELSEDEHYTGTIRLTCGLFILQHGLADCIKRFKEMHPHIHFDLLITEETVDLVESQIDLAFRITSKVADGLIAHPLLKIDSILCAHPEYLSDLPKLTHPDQLLQYDCITHHSMQGTWTLSSPHQQPQNYVVKNTFQSNDVHALYQLCKQKMGIAMLPKNIIEQDIQQNNLVHVLSSYKAPQLTLSVVYSSRKFLPQKTQKFIAFIIQTLRQKDL